MIDMKTISIEVPEGFEFDQAKFEKEFLIKKAKKLPGLNDNLSKFIETNVFILDDDGTICVLPPKFIDNNNSILTRSLADAFVALMQLVKYRDIWNEGWQPNWTDKTEKYNIHIYNGKICKDVSYKLQATLIFKTETLRDLFLKEFKPLIESAKPLL